MPEPRFFEAKTHPYEGTYHQSVGQSDVRTGTERFLEREKSIALETYPDDSERQAKLVGEWIDKTFFNHEGVPEFEALDLRGRLEALERRYGTPALYLFGFEREKGPDGNVDRYSWEVSNADVDREFAEHERWVKQLVQLEPWHTAMAEASWKAVDDFLRNNPEPERPDGDWPEKLEDYQPVQLTYRAWAEATQKASRDAIDEFMRANPNPDAPEYQIWKEFQSHPNPDVSDDSSSRGVLRAAGVAPAEQGAAHLGAGENENLSDAKDEAGGDATHDLSMTEDRITRCLPALGIKLPDGVSPLTVFFLLQAQARDGSSFPEQYPDAQATIRAASDRLRGSDPESFWGLAADYTEEIKPSIIELVYILQTVMQVCPPLDDRFTWRSLDEQMARVDDLVAAFDQDLKSHAKPTDPPDAAQVSVAKACATLLRKLGSLPHGERTVPLAPAAQTAQFAFAELLQRKSLLDSGALSSS